MFGTTHVTDTAISGLGLFKNNTVQGAGVIYSGVQNRQMDDGSDQMMWSKDELSNDYSFSQVRIRYVDEV
jgi:hypothetical protein